MRLPCTNRIDEEEWIDHPETSLDDIRDTLRDQAFVNRWLGGGSATWAHVFPILRSCTSDPVRMLCMATGGADLTRRIVTEARRLGKRVEAVALDLNPNTIACARALSQDYPEIAFVQADALRPPFRPGVFDIVTVATFLHHLAPECAVEVLRVAGKLSRGHVVAADLVRSPAAYLAIHVVARIALFNPVSRHDGVASVCRAYTPGEMAELARRAELRNWRLSQHRFYRMTLVYDGTGGSEGMS